MRVVSIGLSFVLAGLEGCATSEKHALSDASLPAYSKTKSEDHQENPGKQTAAHESVRLRPESDRNTEVSDSEASITPEAFYYMLSGEIAGQRNHLALSADSYMRAAKLTRSPQVAARAVQIAMYAKDYQKAMQAAEVWLDVEPGNLAARKLVAGLQLKQGDLSQAIDNYIYVLSSPEVDFEKSVMQIADSITANSSDPYPVIEALIARFPGTAELPFAYALISARQKDFEKAESNLDKALAVRPDWDTALLMKIKLVAQSGDTDRAMQMLEQATQRFPDNAEIHLLYAKLLAVQHDYSQAVEHFQRVVDLDPDNADAAFALAIMQSTLGEFDSAREGLLKLAKKPKHRQRAYLQLGQLSAENKLYDEALTWLEQVEGGPLAYDARLYASEIMLKQKNLQGALNQLRKLRNQYPQLSARIALREAEVLTESQRPDDAIDVLSQALEGNPADKQLLYMRALLADQVGNYQLAESDLKALLKLEPENVNALNALGYILCNRTERLQEAESYLEQAIALKPGDPAILDSMGWLRFRQNRLDKSLLLLKRAYQQTKDVEIGAHLAEVLWSANQPDEARLVLQEAWNKDSTHELLLDLKKRIPQIFIGIVD